jgi:MurNAc alpha-1-phosphate uridylyltransferase
MKAMILAAGRGERMRPLTDTTPKPLLRAGGKPLIVWTLERLARAGIRDIVVNVSHLGEQIRAALGDGAAWHVDIRYSPEEVALETAGGIANALALLGTEPFIATAADVFCDFDFGRLRDALPRLDKAHLVLVPNPPHHPGGDFGLDGSAVRHGALPRYTFSGTGLYEPSLFDGIAPGTRIQLAAVLCGAIDAGAVSGEVHSGAWRDIGTPERLAALEADLSAR